MSRLYYEALKKLPEEFVDDETEVTELHPYAELPACIVAVNPKLTPILYGDGEWRRVTPITPLPD